MWHNLNLVLSTVLYHEVFVLKRENKRDREGKKVWSNEANSCNTNLYIMSYKSYYYHQTINCDSRIISSNSLLLPLYIYICQQLAHSCQSVFLFT
jgi:hypothetical protein